MKNTQIENTEILFFEKLLNTSSTNLKKDLLFQFINNSKVAIYNENKQQSIDIILKEIFSREIFGIKEKTIINIFESLIKSDKDVFEYKGDIGEYVKNNYHLLSNSPKKVNSLNSFLGISKEIEYSNKYSFTNNFLTVLYRLKNTTLLESYKNIIIDCFKELEPDTIKWIARFLVKKPRFGINISLINDVFYDLDIDLIKTHSIQLATNYKKEYIEKFPVYLEPKYNGFRVHIEYLNNIHTLYSRSGDDITKSFPDVILFLENNIFNKFKSYKLDVEFISLNHSLQSIQKRITRKYDIDKQEKVIIQSFDLLELNGKELYNVKYLKRKELLKSNFTNSKINEQLKIVDMKICNTFADIDRYYKYYLDLSMEGVVIKTNDIYHFKRHRTWLKKKPVETIELEIKDFSFGEGKNGGKVSSITLKDSSEELLVSLGSGFTEEDINKFTTEQSQLIGKIVEVGFDAVSVTDNGYSLLYPRFKGIRIDKTKPDSVLTFIQPK
jgi:hypothetical protein